MSIALNQKRPSAPGRPIRRALPWALMWLCLAILVGHVAYDVLGPMRLHASQEPGRRTAPEATAVPQAKEQAAAPSAATSVTLPESKFQQAKIATEPARVDRLPTEVGVVGMIQPNADQQVEVRPRATGIIREVHAVLGQKVKQGDILVILDSPEVGKARLDLRARQRELVTARFEAAWKREIAANVKTLIPELQKDIAEDIENRHQPGRKERHDLDAEHKIGTPVTRAEKIEKNFADKNLGTYRGTLLQPFADYEIAVHEEEKNFDLRSKNIVGEHPFVVAQHTREGMQAKLEGAIEQVRYDAAQEERIADQAMRQAEAAVVDAAQRLRILGVSEDIRHLLEHPEEGNTLAATEDVTYYQIVAPFDGIIMKKWAVRQPEGRDERRALRRGRPPHGLGQGRCPRVRRRQAVEAPGRHDPVPGHGLPRPRVPGPAHLRRVGRRPPDPRRSRSWRRPTTPRACSRPGCSCASSWTARPSRRR